MSTGRHIGHRACSPTSATFASRTSSVHGTKGSSAPVTVWARRRASSAMSDLVALQVTYSEPAQHFRYFRRVGVRCSRSATSKASNNGNSKRPAPLADPSWPGISLARTEARSTPRLTTRKAIAVEDPASLRLAPIDQRDWRAAVAVQVFPDQVRLVAGHQPVALVILAKAYVRAGDLDWEPLALTAGTSVVGVVALAHARAHTDLLHLAIDVSKQGRGVGSAAVDLLVAHIAETRPSSQEVRLTVHPENARAQRLYRSQGFMPNGQVRDGEPMWSLDLTRR